MPYEVVTARADSVDVIDQPQSNRTFELFDLGPRTREEDAGRAGELASPPNPAEDSGVI